MVTGSFASSMLGMPRTTRDLDVVVEPSEPQLAGLIAAFDPAIWLECWAREMGVSDLLERIRKG